MTTPSKVAMETVEKTLRILKEIEYPHYRSYREENMKIAEPSYVREQIRKLDAPFGGEIAFDRGLGDSVGDARRLLGIDFAQSLSLSTFEFKLQPSEQGGENVSGQSIPQHKRRK